jgi:hypothetical protein
MHTKFWSPYFYCRDNFEHLAIDKSIILKCILARYGMNVWSGFNWIKTEFNGGGGGVNKVRYIQFR